MTSAAEHFLELHRKTLRLVPLRGKAAFLRGWQNLHLSEQDITSWSRQGVNWGIITGDTLVVIDTDTDDAEAWLRQQKIDSTVAVCTGGGGMHRYFLSPPDVEIHSHVGLHGVRGLDIKGWNSYVVAPGSIHPGTGKRYEFVPGRELGELHELPMFEVRWIQRKQPRAIVNTIAIESDASISGKIRDVQAYVRGIKSYENQGGDRQCFTAACFLIEAGLSPDEALAELVEWNVTNAFPPWEIFGSSGLAHKVRYACRRLLGFDPGVEWEQRGS